MSKHSSLVLVSTLAALLYGCGSTQALHYKDGSEVHVVQCTGASWIGCLEKASKICKSNGYDVLERNTAKTSGFFNTTDNKELIIRCKANISPSAPSTTPNTSDQPTSQSK